MIKKSSPMSALLPLAGALLALALALSLSACAGGEQVRTAGPPAVSAPTGPEADPADPSTVTAGAAGEAASATDTVQPPAGDASGDPVAAADGMDGDPVATADDAAP